MRFKVIIITRCKMPDGKGGFVGFHSEHSTRDEAEDSLFELIGREGTGIECMICDDEGEFGFTVDQIEEMLEEDM